VTKHWETARTEAFSDGVFAIAITLLVLDISIPKSEIAHLGTAILHAWPDYLGYVTSFLTIGGVWLTHHAIFRRLRLADARVMRLNLLLLMAVAFLPFPTRLMTEAVRDLHAERTAVIFYGASLLVISIIFAGLWTAASQNTALLKPEVTDDEVAAVTRASRPNIGFYATATVLGVFTPRAAVFLYFVIAIVAVFRARGD
jgi:TMEM175 potassium channel family protein